MSCSQGVSVFEQKKQQLFNANIWKSNFINIWRQYGTFKYVNGVECFDYYRIDGDGAGQRRMSTHLRQPTLWQDTMDNALDWVHLVFNLNKLVELTPENITLWLDDYKAKLGAYTFAKLYYTIVNDVVTDAYFSSADALVPVTPPTNPVTYKPTTYTRIDDVFLNHLAKTIAERSNIDMHNVTYDTVVSLGDVENLMNTMASYHGVIKSSTVYIFDLPMLEEEIRDFLMAKSIGTDLLDQLAVEGTIIRIGSVSSGTMIYAFPVEVAKKMNGLDFVNLVQMALDFNYKRTTHWYDFFVKFMKLILAGIALYFQQYWLAAALLTSQIADLTGNKYLKILATVLSLYAGGVTSLTDIGVSEAVELLFNVYGLYMELSYKPEKVTNEDVVNKDQSLFYKAPYEAYSNLYCYKPLISISISAI